VDLCEDSYPMITVSWCDAVAFANALSRAEGVQARAGSASSLAERPLNLARLPASTSPSCRGPSASPADPSGASSRRRSMTSSPPPSSQHRPRGACSMHGAPRMPRDFDPAYGRRPMVVETFLPSGEFVHAGHQ